MAGRLVAAGQQAGQGTAEPNETAMLGSQQQALSISGKLV